MMRHGLVMALGFLLLAGTGMAQEKKDEPKKKIERIGKDLVGKPAPDIVGAFVLNGKASKLSNYKGKVVLLGFRPQAFADLRAQIGDDEHADVLRVVLARAARSARLTTHFDLDFPRVPQQDEYWCHKHRRRCRPVEHADHFLRRYGIDTVERIRAFARVRAKGRRATVLHGDARVLDVGGRFDGVITSPPYPGLIDYHEQHRYAYELLGLEDLRTFELGSAEQGTSARALDAYVDGIADVLARSKRTLRARAPVVIVVNDRRDLYPEILDRAGLRLERDHACAEAAEGGDPIAHMGADIEGEVAGLEEAGIERIHRALACIVAVIDPQGSGESGGHALAKRHRHAPSRIARISSGMSNSYGMAQRPALDRSSPNRGEAGATANGNATR